MILTLGDVVLIGTFQTAVDLRMIGSGCQMLDVQMDSDCGKEIIFELQFISAIKYIAISCGMTQLSTNTVSALVHATVPS